VDLWRLEWVVRRELDLKEEDATSIRRVALLLLVSIRLSRRAEPEIKFAVVVHAVADVIRFIGKTYRTHDCSLPLEL
jgi:hypothetical protein